jgi:hypothetical protein
MLIQTYAASGPLLAFRTVRGNTKLGGNAKLV